MIDWHRLLGVAFTHEFQGYPLHVETEKDISLQQQYLDIIILRKTNGEFAEPMPDGLEDLVAYNLLSFKSVRDSFNPWTFQELTGHYVNYRKQISPSRKKLLPEQQFRLYGISISFPEKLSKQITLKKLRDGVYEALWMRLIVLSELPVCERNVVWHLVSGDAGKFQYGVNHWKHSTEMKALISQLHRKYKQEEFDMSYTMENFREDHVRESLSDLTLEERLRGLQPEERLRGLQPEERLRGLQPEERLRGLQPEERLRGLQPEERLRGLQPEERLQGLETDEILARMKPQEIKAYLEKLEKGND